MLEKKFNRQLSQSGSRCTHHLPECGTPDVAVDCRGAIELRMVEDIETLKPELQGLRFSQRQVLEKCHVVIVHPRPVKKAPFGRARRPQGVFAELRGIEIRMSVARI